jgi:hypothetical protein
MKIRAFTLKEFILMKLVECKNLCEFMFNVRIQVAAIMYQVLGLNSSKFITAQVRIRHKKLLRNF